MEDQDLEYVGFWPRVGAAIIDTVLLMLVTWPILIAIYGWSYFSVDVNKPIIAGSADFFISWIFPIFGVVLFWVYKQATPGKMAVSARVVDATTGRSLSFGQALGRYLAYFVSILFLFLGIIWIAFDPKKQGWHDKLAGTVVIRPRNNGPRPVRFDGA